MWDTQQSTMYEEEEEESIVCAVLKASVTVCEVKPFRRVSPRKRNHRAETTRRREDNPDD